MFFFGFLFLIFIFFSIFLLKMVCKSVSKINCIYTAVSQGQVHNNPFVVLLCSEKFLLAKRICNECF